MTDTRMISSNDHLLEAPTLWVDRVPAALREAAPRVVDTDDGGQAWIFDDTVSPVAGIATVAGEDPETFSFTGAYRYSDIKAGSYDPKARIADMDLDGVEVHTCLPTMIGLAGTRLLTLSDPELRLACVRAYNDYILDEWCAFAPERLVPIGVLPMWDVELTVAEARRALDRGMKGFTFPEDPGSLGLPSIHNRGWNPLYEVMQEADLPLTLHMFSNYTCYAGTEQPFCVDLTVLHTTSITTMVNLLDSPLFLDFPNLKIVLSESGLGWVPFFLEKVDFYWDRHRGYARTATTTQNVPPSELFPGHIWVTIQSHDATGIAERDRIGIDQIMWQCDYPHADSPWPHSREILGAQLADIPEADRAAILGGNAAKLYKLG
jgi:predicted TIM-barrel fold metal-dependent hydrolase